MITARLAAQLRCYVPERATETWARLASGPACTRPVIRAVRKRGISGRLERDCVDFERGIREECDDLAPEHDGVTIAQVAAGVMGVLVHPGKRDVESQIRPQRSTTRSRCSRPPGESARSLTSVAAWRRLQAPAGVGAPCTSTMIGRAAAPRRAHRPCPRHAEPRRRPHATSARRRAAALPRHAGRSSIMSPRARTSRCVTMTVRSASTTSRLMPVPPLPTPRERSSGRPGGARQRSVSIDRPMRRARARLAARRVPRDPDPGCQAQPARGYLVFHPEDFPVVGLGAPPVGQLVREIWMDGVCS